LTNERKGAKILAPFLVCINKKRIEAVTPILYIIIQGHFEP
jgi:hypothetical protein